MSEAIWLTKPHISIWVSVFNPRTFAGSELTEGSAQPKVTEDQVLRPRGHGQDLNANTVCF